MAGGHTNTNDTITHRNMNVTIIKQDVSVCVCTRHVPVKENLETGTERTKMMTT